MNLLNFLNPEKATSGRPAYLPKLYTKSNPPKPNFSFRCQVKIRKVKPKVDSIEPWLQSVMMHGGLAVAQG